MIRELSFLAAANGLILSLSGCANMLERQPPSREGYLAEYLEYFDPSQIEKLDYVYKGGIGGAVTVGRAQFKDSVKLKDSLVEERTKTGPLETGIYDPAEMADESDGMWFRHQWEVHAGGTIPSWFDFPFHRKMRTLREVSEGRDGIPCRGKEWYIDDERKIVYVLASWG